MHRSIELNLSALLALSALTFAARAQEPPPVVVEVATASVARVAPRRWAPGDVVSRDDARLATSGAGRLEYVAEVGTRVRAGERIAKLEDEAVRLQVEDTKAEVARIDAQRAMSERQLRRIQQLANNSISQTQLDEVRAPFPGVVTERLAQRGEYVATGAAIAHLVDTVHLEARVQAPLKLVDLVKPNMELPVKSGAEHFKAKVRAVVPVGEARSRQFELRLTLADNALNVGAPIEAGLPEREAANALVVPRDAIAVRQGGDYLMRVRADQTAERVAVTSVATDGDLVTVRGAVSAGDIVVVRGVERLQSGQRVTVLKRDAAVREAGGGRKVGAR